MGRGIGQRTDDLQLLDDRARPSMRDDQRQGFRMGRADVNEVDIQPINFGDELGQAVELRLDLQPLLVGLPMAHELLQHG